METKRDIQAAIDAGAALTGFHVINDLPVLVVPDGYEAHDFEHLLDAPIRHKGVSHMLDAASFIAYVNEFKDAPGLATRLYYTADPKPQFVAVFNDATGDEAAWADFRSVYDAPLSKEWQTWLAQDGKRMGQEDFALFIERNLPDIVTPPAADMLEIATTFQAKKGVDFASGTRLANGEVQFKYEETIAAKAGEKGQFSVPERIEIVIPVFEGSTIGDRLVAKFRYRITDGKLAMWYELDRPHNVLDAAVTDLRNEIETGTLLKAFKGTPAR